MLTDSNSRILADSIIEEAYILPQTQESIYPSPIDLVPRISDSYDWIKQFFPSLDTSYAPTAIEASSTVPQFNTTLLTINEIQSTSCIVTGISIDIEGQVYGLAVALHSREEYGPTPEYGTIIQINSTNSTDNSTEENRRRFLRNIESHFLLEEDINSTNTTTTNNDTNSSIINYIYKGENSKKPNSYQIQNGVDYDNSNNYTVAAYIKISEIGENITYNLSFFNLLPGTNYSIYLTAGNAIPDLPDLIEDSEIIQLQFLTEKTKDLNDLQAFFIQSYIVSLLFILFIFI